MVICIQKEEREVTTMKKTTVYIIIEEGTNYIYKAIIGTKAEAEAIANMATGRDRLAGGNTNYIVKTATMND